MSEEDFLSALDAHPHDAGIRRVYSDWLEERGDARAAYLRAAVALHQRPSRQHLREACDLGAGVDGAWRTRVALADVFGSRFACVPGDRFAMGGGGGTPGENRVEIAHDFCLGVYPVTQGQWQDVMGDNPS